jgi:hypothetical protein
VAITRTLHLYASRIARLARLRERIDDPPAILKRDTWQHSHNAGRRASQAHRPAKRPPLARSCCTAIFSIFMLLLLLLVSLRVQCMSPARTGGAQRACAACQCAHVLGCVLGGHDLRGAHRRTSSVARLIAAGTSARQRSIFELTREGEHGKLQLTACASFGGVTSES